MSRFSKKKISDDDLLLMINKITGNRDAEFHKIMNGCVLRHLRGKDQHAPVFRESDAEKMIDIARKMGSDSFKGTPADFVLYANATHASFFGIEGLYGYLWRRAKIIYRLSVEKGVSFQDIVNDESLKSGIDFLMGEGVSG
jgi:hypothetical protein